MSMALLLPHVRRLAALLLLAGAGAALAQNVSFAEPKDGATVGTTFKVRLDVKGLRLAPAGEAQAGAGHHHVLVNQEPVAAGEEIPFTRRHIHLNKGQSEIEITLQPGTYKLTAQAGDGTHKSLGSTYSQTITVTVK
jgi:hypothetical protein